MINNQPSKLTITELKGGFNKIYITNSNSDDADLLGRAYWYRPVGSTIYSLAKFDSFSDKASLTGLTTDTTYEIFGAFYDSMVDDSMLAAFALVTLSDMYTCSTISRPIISNVTSEKVDVDIGVTLPNVSFEISGSADILEIQYKEEGTSTWVNYYSGACQSKVVVPAPKVGIFRFRCRGIMVTNGGLLNENSSYIEYANTVDIGFNLTNPSAPASLTLKVGKVQDTFERFDVKAAWTWNKGSGAGIKAFVVEYVSSAEYASTLWVKAKTISAGTALETIIPNFPYNIPHKVRVSAYSYGEAPNNKASSTAVDLTITSATPLDSSFTKSTLVELFYSGIYGYRMDGITKIPTFLMDAASGNLGLGTPVSGVFPIQLNGSTGTLSVDGGIVTKTINAANFVLTNFTGKDNPALYSEGKTFGTATAGIWTGYDNATGIYKFDIGNAANYMRWDGTDLIISGGVKIGTALGSIDIEEVVGKSTVWVYTVSTTKPSTPTSTAYPPVGWSKTPVAITNPDQLVWTCQGILNEITGILDTGQTWSIPVQFSGSVGATGPAGTSGAAGLNNATLYLYQRATSTPAIPSTTVTYTFASKSITGQNNGWLVTVPAGTNPLYVTLATASSAGATDTIASNEWSAPTILAQDGATGSSGIDGAPGLNSATIFLYQRAASAPAKPSTTSTYTFATGVLTGQGASWTQTVPAGTNPLYVTTATAASTSATDTIASTEWATPNILAQDGADGAAGLNNATLYLYQRAASVPSIPSTTVTYNFATKAITGQNNGWLTSVPAGSTPLYVTLASASSSGPTDTIASNEWSAPTVLAQDGATGATGSTGAPGLNSATIFLYQRAASAPAKPSTTSTYTFATGVLTGQGASWTQTVPAGTNPLYVTTATAASTSATDTIASTEWATPNILAKDGANGATGAAGARGAGFYVIANSTGVWSDSTANSACPGGIPVSDDVVTIYKLTDTKISVTKRYNGSTWVTPGLVVHGDMIATGTIAGDRITASTEITAPVLKGGKIELVGTSYMKIQGSTPFGPDSLIEWYGPRLILSGNIVDYANIRKSNAIMYLSSAGDAYFGGSLSAGVLKTGVTNTDKNPYAVGSYPVTIGPFGTNGNSKNVVVSFGYSAFSESATAPSTPDQPSLSWELQRKIGGGSWSTVVSGTFSGTITTEFEAEPPAHWIIFETCNGSYTFTDTSTSTLDFNYRVLVTGYNRFHITANVDVQTLTLISTEQ